MVKEKLLLEYQLHGGEPPGLNNRLRVHEGGFCTCLIATESFLNPSGRECEAGYYEGKVSDAAIQNLLSFLENSADGIGEEPLPCDSPVARYTLARNGKEICMMHDRIPPELWDATKIVILQLREQQSRKLSVDELLCGATWSQPVWTARLGLAFAEDRDVQGLCITLANRGRERIEISNPRALGDGTQHTGLVLDAFPVQKPGQKLSRDGFDETIRRMNMPALGGSGGGKAEPPFVALSPAGEVRIEHTPEELAEYCMKRPAKVVALFTGTVRAGERPPLQVNIGSNAVELFPPHEQGNR